MKPDREILHNSQISTLQGEVSFVFQLPSPLRDSGTHCIGAEIK
jgi:hypothetical protein